MARSQNKHHRRGKANSNQDVCLKISIRWNPKIPLKFPCPTCSSYESNIVKPFPIRKESLNRNGAQPLTEKSAVSWLIPTKRECTLEDSPGLRSYGVPGEGIWLVVEPTPLKNMKVSWDYSQYMEK